MANGEKRDVKPSLLKGLINGIKSALSDRMDVPANDEPGALVDRRLSGQYERDDDSKVAYFQPFQREFLQSLDRDEIARLKKLLAVRTETIAWIDGKNDRELKNLDGAVEFVSSSRTAAKVLMYVSGVAVAFFGGAVAFAKNGYDLFSLIRGVK